MYRMRCFIVNQGVIISAVKGTVNQRTGTSQYTYLHGLIAERLRVTSASSSSVTEVAVLAQDDDLSSASSSSTLGAAGARNHDRDGPFLGVADPPDEV